MKKAVWKYLHSYKKSIYFISETRFLYFDIICSLFTNSGVSQELTALCHYFIVCYTW
jgi:hypothetical protein